MILAVSSSAAMGMSTGAPVEACTGRTGGLIPNHTDSPNTAVGNGPFSIDISIVNNEYIPGLTYTSE